MPVRCRFQNARAMLRAISTGAPWPQAIIQENERAAVRAAHQQLDMAVNLEDLAAACLSSLLSSLALFEGLSYEGFYIDKGQCLFQCLPERKY